MLVGSNAIKARYADAAYGATTMPWTSGDDKSQDRSDLERCRRISLGAVGLPPPSPPTYQISISG
eukprot:scaffold181418_cov32-Tisochrysis_lutea.AAC.3